jgi:CBS domain-containing protein
MKVRDIMRGGAVAVIRPEDCLAVATQVMLSSNVRHLPVLRGGEVVGMLSERDIFRRGSAVGREAARDPVERVMSTPVVIVEPDRPLAAAIWLMVGGKVGCLPVVGPTGLVGIITMADVVRHQFDTTRAASAAAPRP